MGPTADVTQGSESDFATQLEFYGMSALGETEPLLARLHLSQDEHPYFGLAYDLSTAKRYLLSRSLMAVQYAAAALFRLAQHIRRRDTLDQPHSEGLSHILTTSIITEQSTWRRRLAEVLATLVNFTSTISDEHFFCYLLLEERLKCWRESENDRQDFGVDSAISETRLKTLDDKLSEVGGTISFPVWYSSEGRKVRTAAKIVRTALSKGSGLQRRALGYSYAHGFSDPSHAIHFSTTPSPRSMDDTGVRAGAAQIFLLSQCISECVAQLEGTSRATPPAVSEAINASRAAGVAPGDFVAVILDRRNVFLGEVVKLLRSPWGDDGGVRVRFLDDPPYADLSEDNIPIDQIHLFQERAKFLEEVGKVDPRVAETTDDERIDACRRAVVVMWRTAFRDVYLRMLANSDSEQ
jgi:hypothetical protein